ncbi:response regulator transcription factor [Lacibacter luteus]|uniref:Response regulator transcription factor n=1 Tax=Lacibacter luteus TaxID=2508719 RepID=A0A4Q1CFI7_9BACT|nr:response regulator transcription factor [Lacibacter luteus]RXK58559.1 response regulator transcription factor [Lacibacter luteus]
MTTASNPITIVIADDHEIFRDGFTVMIKKFPEITIIGEAENGTELVALVRKLRPDVVLTDIKMPKMDGIEATKLLVQEQPGTNIIALSMFDEDNLIVDMLEAGARGYLLKNAHKDEIIEAIKAVYKEQTYYCRHTSSKLMQMIAKSRFTPSQKKERPQFTDKEISIIRLICEQLSNKEIADRLNLSVRTIEGYREKIQEKMDVHNTAGIVVYAIKNKIYSFK